MHRDLFEAWCEDPKNGVIIADFAVQGTLARELLAEPHDVMLRTGIKVPLTALWCCPALLAAVFLSEDQQTSGCSLLIS